MSRRAGFSHSDIVAEKVIQNIKMNRFSVCDLLFDLYLVVQNVDNSASGITGV